MYWLQLIYNEFCGSVNFCEILNSLQVWIIILKEKWIEKFAHVKYFSYLSGENELNENICKELNNKSPEEIKKELEEIEKIVSSQEVDKEILIKSLNELQKNYEKKSSSIKKFQHVHNCIIDYF